MAKSISVDRIRACATNLEIIYKQAIESEYSFEAEAMQRLCENAIRLVTAFAPPRDEDAND